MRRHRANKLQVGPTIPRSEPDAGDVDPSNEETDRLRSALFAAADSHHRRADDVVDDGDDERVLARADRPIRKRTPSDLGHPNGKRTLSFGR